MNHKKQNQKELKILQRGLEDEPYPCPIGLFDLSGRGFDWLKKKSEEEIARKYQGANDPFWDDRWFSFCIQILVKVQVWMIDGCPPVDKAKYGLELK